MIFRLTISMLLFLISAKSEAQYSKLSFPSSGRLHFIPWVIGVDHNETPSTRSTKCTNYRGKHNFPYCYAGHEGSDYMLTGGFMMMHLGVNVRAASGGVVMHVEDGHGDHCFANPFAKGPVLISCLDNPTMEANYVTILQDDGLFAFYFHLRRNSTLQKEGDLVECGTKIAQVGSSGISSSPHIHFELRKLKEGAIAHGYTYDELYYSTEAIDPYALNLWKNVKGGKPVYRCSKK